MSIEHLRAARALIVTAGTHTCAIPLQYVVETMRPLAIERVPEMPPYVRGVSIIRGEPVPVVDLAVLLESGQDSAPHGRFVTLRVGERRVALGVATVIGLKDLDEALIRELPPLLRVADVDRIDALGANDAQLLIVLRAARLVPEDVWAVLAAAMPGR
jgi:purine-binding chemotaxis protein CheW